jgi:hypothetical protein
MNGATDKEVAMTTLAEMIANARQPLVVRWVLVTDNNGRTRPEMRWEPSVAAHTSSTDEHVTLAA